MYIDHLVFENIHFHYYVDHRETIFFDDIVFKLKMVDLRVTFDGSSSTWVRHASIWLHAVHSFPEICSSHYDSLVYI